MKMEILGQTIDDAAEAFDKTGKNVGFGYPAGPEIDKRSNLGKPIFKFSRQTCLVTILTSPALKLCTVFSQRKAKTEPFIQENINDLCASIQHSILNILLVKLVKGI